MEAVNTERELSVLLANEDHDALEQAAQSLASLGHSVTASAVNLAEISEGIAREAPDIAIVILHGDEDHALELVSQIATLGSQPVIAVTPEDDAEFAAAAADRGVHACMQSDGAESLQAAIEVAMKRHREVERLDHKVTQLEAALERRAIIERAKGILMERYSLGDRDAFDRMRSHARSNNRTVVDLAGDVCSGYTDIPGA